MGRNVRKLRIALHIAALAVVLPPALVPAVEPTTPEERTEAVRLARELEQNPFGAEARQQRGMLFRWWKEVPDLRLRWCQPLMLDLQIGDEELAAAVLVQAVLSGGAYMIENPGAANEPRSIWIAGVEGALRTYRRAVELNPDVKSADLEQLVALERAGRLAEYVDRHATECD